MLWCKLMGHFERNEGILLESTNVSAGWLFKNFSSRSKKGVHFLIIMYPAVCCSWKFQDGNLFSSFLWPKYCFTHTCTCFLVRDVPALSRSCSGGFLRMKVESLCLMSTTKLWPHALQDELIIPLLGRTFNTVSGFSHFSHKTNLLLGHFEHLVTFVTNSDVRSSF